MTCKVKSPSFNPYPFFMLMILLIMLILYSENGYAYEREKFCTEEQIQNFEESGQYDETDDFYILSNNIVYNIYSWYDEQIYYNSDYYEFTVNENQMVIGYIENGIRHIEGYSTRLSMYDYKDACILKINDKTNIIVENEIDSFLTNNGVEIKNEYSICEMENVLFSLPCQFIVLFNNITSYLITNMDYFILICLSLVFTTSIVLFIKIKEVL